MEIPDWSNWKPRYKQSIKKVHVRLVVSEAVLWLASKLPVDCSMPRTFFHNKKVYINILFTKRNKKTYIIIII